MLSRLKHLPCRLFRQTNSSQRRMQCVLCRPSIPCLSVPLNAEDVSNISAPRWEQDQRRTLPWSWNLLHNATSNAINLMSKKRTSTVKKTGHAQAEPSYLDCHESEQQSTASTPSSGGKPRAQDEPLQAHTLADLGSEQVVGFAASPQA